MIRFKNSYFLIVLLIYLSLMACGIDTIVYLMAKPVVRDTAALVFEGPVVQDANYYGFFIFYKIYANETDASSDLSSLEAKQNAVNAVPGASVETFLISTNGLDYQPLVLDEALSIPTLDTIDLDTKYFANINITSNSDIMPTLIIKDEIANTVVREYDLKRAALDSSGQYLSFLDEPQNGNVDYKASSSDEKKDEYHIQFFAVAYGLDFNNLNDLYGNAVYLGRVKRYY